MRRQIGSASREALSQNVRGEAGRNRHRKQWTSSVHVQRKPSATTPLLRREDERAKSATPLKAHRYREDPISLDARTEAILHINDEAMRAMQTQDNDASRMMLVEALRLSREGLVNADASTRKAWLHVYALSLGNFGCLLHRQQSYTDALIALEEASKRETEVYGHPSCSTMLNCSSVLLALNRPTEALPIAEKCVLTAQEADALLFVTSLHNLAVILGAQPDPRRQAAAVPTFLRALRESERLLGPQHPTTILLREKCGLASDGSKKPETQKVANGAPYGDNPGTGTSVGEKRDFMPPPLMRSNFPGSLSAASPKANEATPLYTQVPHFSRSPQKSDKKMSDASTYTIGAGAPMNEGGVLSPMSMRQKAVSALRTLNFGQPPPAPRPTDRFSLPAVLDGPSGIANGPKRGSNQPATSNNTPAGATPDGGHRPPQAHKSSSVGRPPAYRRFSKGLEEDPLVIANKCGRSGSAASPVREKASDASKRTNGTVSTALSFNTTDPSVDTKWRVPVRPATATERSVFRQYKGTTRASSATRAQREEAHYRLQQERARREMEKEAERLAREEERRTAAAVCVQRQWRHWWAEEGQARRIAMQRHQQEEQQRRQFERLLLQKEYNEAQERESAYASNAARACAQRWLEKTQCRRYLVRRGVAPSGADERTLRHSIVALQSWWRGVCSRRAHPERRPPTAAQDLASYAQSQKHHYAALVIQAAYRAHSARQEAAWRREEKQSGPAHLVQLWWRDRLAYLRAKGVDRRTTEAREIAARVIQVAWRRYQTHVAIYVYLLAVQMDAMRRTKLLQSASTPQRRNISKQAYLDIKTRALGAGGARPPVNPFLLPQPGQPVHAAQARPPAAAAALPTLTTSPEYSKKVKETEEKGTEMTPTTTTTATTPQKKSPSATCSSRSPKNRGRVFMFSREPASTRPSASPLVSGTADNLSPDVVPRGQRAVETAQAVYQRAAEIEERYRRNAEGGKHSSGDSHAKEPETDSRPPLFQTTFRSTMNASVRQTFGVD